MKIEYLPEKQEANNRRINRALGVLFSTLLLLIICPTLVAAWLLLEGVPPPPAPQCVGPDRTSVLGDAIVLTQEFILCTAECPDGSMLTIGHQEPLLLTRVRTAELVPGSTVTLMRVQMPIPEGLVHPLSDVENGQRVITTGWEGTIIERNGALTVQPTLPKEAVMPLYAMADSALIGLGFFQNGESIVISVRVLKQRFIELN